MRATRQTTARDCLGDSLRPLLGRLAHGPAVYARGHGLCGTCLLSLLPLAWPPLAVYAQNSGHPRKRHPKALRVLGSLLDEVALDLMALLATTVMTSAPAMGSTPTVTCSDAAVKSATRTTTMGPFPRKSATTGASCTSAAIISESTASSYLTHDVQRGAERARTRGSHMLAVPQMRAR